MKIKSYVKQALHFLAGETDKVVAEQNFRSADAAVNGQVFALKSEEVQKEQALANAAKNLDEAKYPQFAIKNTSTYLASIVSAKRNLDEAQAQLDEVKESIVFFQGLSAEFNTEVEEEEA